MYYRDELFKGPYVEKMSELIVQLNRNYRNSGNSRGMWFSDVAAAEFDFQSGDHNQNGILIARGAHIKKDIDFPAAQIQDMAPTIL